jgi:hypothetical protein
LRKPAAGSAQTAGAVLYRVAVGALLAHLALDPGARTVLDPMAGHGDLLDAAALTAQARELGSADCTE